MKDLLLEIGLSLVPTRSTDPLAAFVLYSHLTRNRTFFISFSKPIFGLREKTFELFFGINFVVGRHQICPEKDLVSNAEYTLDFKGCIFLPWVRSFVTYNKLDDA